MVFAGSRGMGQSKIILNPGVFSMETTKSRHPESISKLSSPEKNNIFSKKKQTKSENFTLYELERLDFETLFKKYNEYVFNFIENRAGQEASEELFSKVFMIVKEKLPSFEPKGNCVYTAWINSIIKGELSNYFKKINAKKRISPRKLVSLNISKHNDLLIKRQENKIKRNEEKRICIELINNIPDKELKEISKKIYYDEKTIQQIADEKNIPASTIRGKLFRFRRNYSDLLYDD